APCQARSRPLRRRADPVRADRRAGSCPLPVTCHRQGPPHAPHSRLERRELLVGPEATLADQLEPTRTKQDLALVVPLRMGHDLDRRPARQRELFLQRDATERRVHVTNREEVTRRAETGPQRAVQEPANGPVQPRLLARKVGEAGSHVHARGDRARREYAARLMDGLVSVDVRRLATIKSAELLELLVDGLLDRREPCRAQAPASPLRPAEVL